MTKNPNKAKYDDGDITELTASPATGWRFGHWSGALTGMDNPASITIHGNITVTANYSQIPYTLTVNSTHGTVTKSPDLPTYHYGDMVNLNVTPDAGWTFTGWLPSLVDNQIMITGDMILTATYTQTTYTLTVNSAHGTVTRSPDQSTYHYGDVVTLSVTSEVGWTFTGWTPPLVDNQITITDNTGTGHDPGRIGRDPDAAGVDDPVGCRTGIDANAPGVGEAVVECHVGFGVNCDGARVEDGRHPVSSSDLNPDGRCGCICRAEGFVVAVGRCGTVCLGFDRKPRAVLNGSQSVAAPDRDSPCLGLRVGIGDGIAVAEPAAVCPACFALRVRLGVDADRSRIGDDRRAVRGRAVRTRSLDAPKVRYERP